MAMEQLSELCFRRSGRSANQSVGPDKDENPAAGSMISHLYKKRKGGPATNCLSGSCSASGVALAAVPLGLGTTGRVAATSLKEALAMEEVMASPGGVELTNVMMSDARWPASQGWVKMEQIVNGINIQYLKNTILGVFDDFKFKP